jgi:hypothetical protein
MAHYAFLNENNIVTQVIVGINENELIEGKNPESWYAEFVGKPCKRTSYNTYGGQHLNGGVPFRLNYAGVGYTYRPDLDGFISPQPHASWILNEATGLWDSPEGWQPEADLLNP